MKIKKDFHKVKVPILNDEYCVWVVWGKNEKVDKFLRKWYENDPSVNYKAFMDNRGVCINYHEYNPMIIINVENKKENDDSFIATVAHEAVHAVNNTFNSIGEYADRGEFFAHSVAAIVRAVEKYKKTYEKVYKI